MDRLAAMKLIIGIAAGNTNDDALLTYYLDAAVDRLGAATSDYDVIELAVKQYNKRGIEGAVSHTAGDVTTRWSDTSFDTTQGGSGGGSQMLNIIPWKRRTGVNGGGCVI